MSFVRSFSSADTLTASTLLGTVMQWRISPEVAGEGAVEELWKKEALGLEKVNALIANDTKVVIGGFAKDGKGIIEVWDKRPPPIPPS